MPRTKKPNAILDKFKVLDDKSATICKIDGCEKKIKCVVIGNLKRDIATCHKDQIKNTSSYVENNFWYLSERNLV